MKSIKELLLELISVQSDSGTAMEAEMGEKLISLIREDPYFQEHPDQCGAFVGSDPLRRPVVWALRRGCTNRTVILSGHYDAVEIDCYGALKPWALKPESLRSHMREATVSPRVRKALQSRDWLFGRGAADMKAGQAINLFTLFDNSGEASILYCAVCDEENMSAGCRALMPLLLKLKETFNLDYRVAVLTEPQFSAREDSDKIELYRGGMGKILPIVVARGSQAHSADNVKGLNAALMVSEFARLADLDTELMSSDLGMTTQPPSVQILRDLKTTYDVSLPEFAAAGVSVLFLGDDAPKAIMERMTVLCRIAFSATAVHYNRAFDAALKAGIVEEKARLSLNTQVYSVAELLRAVRERADSESALSSLTEKLSAELEQGETLQTISCHYIKSLIQLSGVDGPVFAVGFAPPYYPARSISHMNVENLENKKWEAAICSALSEQKVCSTVKHYVPVMADISYFSCPNLDAEQKMMTQLAVPSSLYSVPFDAIARLNLPCYVFGPRCADCHQWTERVYMPDVEQIIPTALRSLIKSI